MARETLDMETPRHEPQKGCFLTRTVSFCLLLSVIAAIISTGLLVYYFAGCLPKNEFDSKSLIENLNLVKSRYPDVRLPRSIIPDHYELRLTPYLPPGNFSFKGNVKIAINVTESTSKIVLHSKELMVDSEKIWVRDDKNRSIFVKAVTNETDKDFLILHLAESLRAGRQYRVKLEFSGTLNDILAGFYKSSYKDGNQTRWLATTQFQATDARRAFPCFDEPAMKAKFKIYLGRHMNYTAISNMPLKQTIAMENAEGYAWDEFEESVPMSTYLVAFVVSDFKSMREGKFSVWARKSALNQANYTLNIGPRILEHFETFFGIPFPLPKMDMIAIPDFAAGAMENWGLITYRETAMLYKNGSSTRLNQQRVATVVAHELAHQWFGNLVTPSWWSDLWLNEGFASYVEYLGVDAVEPSWKFLEQFVVLDANDAFDLDALQSSHPISAKVNHPDEIDEIFDKVSYSKGASIIRMMDHFLRRSVLKNGLTRYLKSKQYSNAEQDDLWSALTRQAHEDQSLHHSMTVKDIMDTWTLQTGYPVVHVNRNYKNGSVRLTQQRFQLVKSAQPDKSRWWIPLSHTSGDYPDFSSYPSNWMKPESDHIDLPLGLSSDTWVLFNIELTGFYRVNYDTRNWEMLSGQLNNGDLKALSTISRAQLIGDSLNLARAGLLDYEIALNLTQYLQFEEEFVPWQAAYNGFQYLESMLMSTGSFELYKNYVLRLVNKTYEKVGFNDPPTDDHLRALLRELILRLTCRLGHDDCIRNALALFHNWKSAKNPDEENPISPNLKRIVYCTAARIGNVKDWNFLWTRYLNTNSASERENLMSGLACSSEVWILNRLLDRAMSERGDIRKQDVERVFSNIAKASYNGQIIAFRKIRENWPWLLRHFGSGSFTLGRLMSETTKRFNSKFDLDEFVFWAQANKDSLGTALTSVKQVVEYIEANVQWMESNFGNVVRWLETANATP